MLLTSLILHSRALPRCSATRIQSRMAITSCESIPGSDGKRRSRYGALTCPCLQDPQRQSRSAAVSRSENVRHFVDMTRDTARRISTSIVLSFEGRLDWVDDISQACSHRHPFSPSTGAKRLQGRLASCTSASFVASYNARHAIKD